MTTIGFSKEQQYAFNKFRLGENLFITGPGGTGKTHLIRHMVRYMDENTIKYQVCAMTGCAAVLLGNGAKTLHSWSGMGLAKDPKEKVIQKIVFNKKVTSSIKKTRVLIVDEVSMMSKKIFEILDGSLRTIKRVDAPFGGIQIIFTGDFFQLPPIGNPYEEETSMFCFESVRWVYTFKIENHVVLKHIFRQDDGDYKEILNQIRWGELNEASIAVLMKCVKREFTGDVIPTKLFAVRSKTEFVNSRMYDKIEGDEHVYTVQSKTDLKIYMDSGKPIEPEYIMACAAFSKKEFEMEIAKLLEGSNKSQELRLKRGARVMCLHNICVDQGICNGSQGVVVDFAASVETKDQIVPVVLFSNGKRMLIEQVWVQSDELPCIGICQIPLCLAWALTIHKIQGATLSMAEMDLGESVFEYGQTYVALSRIKSLEGLYLSAFQPRRIKANPIVKAFYKNIPEIEYEIENNSSTTNIFRDFELKEEHNDVNVNEIKESTVTDPNVKVVRL